MNWTVRKFLSLPLRQQHKKAAEAARRAYEGTPGDLNQLREWLGFAPVTTLEAIADAYHEHLAHAQQRVREHHLLPNIRTGDREVSSPLLPVVIYLDHLRSAHNVGSIFRTTEAHALGTLSLSPQTPTPEQKQVRDAAMGADQWVPWNTLPLATLPAPIIALETSYDAFPLADFLFPDTFTLVIGNEERGCSQETLQRADHLVEIPLWGRKNSLNVANAYAIAAAEIRRQHAFRTPA